MDTVLLPVINNKQGPYFCQVDFGCILNDTEVTRNVLVTNHSPMDVKYHWLFVDSDLRIEKIVSLNGTLIILCTILRTNSQRIQQI